MTQEALKLALEALKEAQTNDDGMEKWDRNKKAIAAIKERLAQEKALEALHNENERLGLYKDAYAEQEPVGMVQDLFTYTAWEKLDVRGSTKVYLDIPPQRKPLTDEEIFACENSVPDEIVSDRDWCIHFARAIEAKIKENT